MVLRPRFSSRPGVKASDLLVSRRGQRQTPKVTMDADLKDLLRALLSRHRPISELIRDAAETPPEVSKFDSLVFTTIVDAAGLQTVMVPLVRIPSNYDFSCFGLRGWAQDPATFGADAGKVTFNVRESGRNQDIFATTDQQLASLVGPSGPANDLIFPERTLLRAGAELQARFTIDLTVAWANGARRFGFVMFGQMIAKGIGRR